MIISIPDEILVSNFELVVPSIQVLNTCIHDFCNLDVNILFMNIIDDKGIVTEKWGIFSNSVIYSALLFSELFQNFVIFLYTIFVQLFVFFFRILYSSFLHYFFLTYYIIISALR